ncbi:hypothetical protein ABH935_004899 [Catenulispora sp. GAS73]
MRGGHLEASGGRSTARGRPVRPAVWRRPATGRLPLRCCLRRAACRRSLLVVTRVLCPSPRRRLTEPARFGGVKPHRCCCGAASSGWTPPNRAGWLRPPTRRGTQNQHPAWSFGPPHRVVGHAGPSPPKSQLRLPAWQLCRCGRALGAGAVVRADSAGPAPARTGTGSGVSHFRKLTRVGSGIRLVTVGSSARHRAAVGCVAPRRLHGEAAGGEADRAEVVPGAQVAVFFAVAGYPA